MGAALVQTQAGRIDQIGGVGQAAAQRAASDIARETGAQTRDRRDVLEYFASRGATVVETKDLPQKDKDGNSYLAYFFEPKA